MASNLRTTHLPIPLTLTLTPSYLARGKISEAGFADNETVIVVVIVIIVVGDGSGGGGGNRTLQITNSISSDQAKYECVANNTVGTEYSKSTMLYVKVRRVVPTFSIPPPAVSDVTLGASLNLTCVAVGAPMPVVQWRKYPATDITPDDNLPVGKNVLYLTDIQESANYTCTASSQIGVIHATSMVKVQCAY
ncbi:hypothetical protein M0802_016053 [Mischocyttarus mexicanus]|nr:hypothetical protein M0802_016053 [Mischocyttarus mexicanus]